MEGIVTSMDDNSVCLEIDEELYQKESIQLASHKFTDKCYIKMGHKSDRLISLIFSPKENCEIEKIALEFCNELLDQQVRLTVEKSYGNIRDLIVKQAFSPIDNVQDNIKI